MKPFWKYRVGKSNEKNDFEHIMKNYIFGFSSTIQHRWLKFMKIYIYEFPTNVSNRNLKIPNHIFLFLLSVVGLST